MQEYILKFWTKDNRLSGARIFAMSSGEAIEQAKSLYDVISIISWDAVEQETFMKKKEKAKIKTYEEVFDYDPTIEEARSRYSEEFNKWFDEWCNKEE